MKKVKELSFSDREKIEKEIKKNNPEKKNILRNLML
jgi:hypothetical protein